MNIEEHTRADIARIAAQLARNGWAEANAGNISVLLPEDSDDSVWDGADVVTDVLPEPCMELSDRTFFITTAGSRFRKLTMDIKTDIVPVRVSSDGMKVVRPAGSKLPTSEFSSHLLVLAETVLRGWPTASLVHTHSTHMLALSSSDIPAEMLEDAVNRSHPEVAILMSRGVRFLDFMTPGTWELGRETAEAFRESDCVIWRKHGILGLGEDIDSACDAVEIVEKAARLLLLERSAFGKFVGLKDKDLLMSRNMPPDTPEDDDIPDDGDELPPSPPVLEI